eukprot:11585494-Alexandrium_andersonii.AAC.1
MPVSRRLGEGRLLHGGPVREEEHEVILPVRVQLGQRGAHQRALLQGALSRGCPECSGHRCSAKE